MAVTRSVGVVEDDRFQEHRGPPGHPERPERLLAVAEAIAVHRNRLSTIPPRTAAPPELLRIHSPSHLEQLRASLQHAPVLLDADTYACRQSLEVATLAAGASIDLALAVARGEVQTGFAAIRPPGHHAESAQPMGFCLLNNVALAARALQAEEQADRLLIVDWDVHHGNGTQHSFENDPSVLYFSTHQFPFYPGTGAVGETGTGAGVGSTVNVPLPAGSGDAEVVGALQRILVPVARSFRPEMILVSCGFDAHAADPLASLDVSRTGFAEMAAIVRSLADDLCGGRVVFTLEGGYSATSLREGTDALLEVLTDPNSPAVPDTYDISRGSTLRSVVDRVVAAQASHFADLGAP